MNNIFLKVLLHSEYWNRLWEFRKEFMIRVVLTFLTIGMVQFIVFGHLNFSLAFTYERIFSFLILGFYLMSIRSWYKRYLCADRMLQNNEQYRRKPIRELLPTYFINYPVILIVLYVLISNIPGISEGWRYGLAFVSGWAMDELWADGRILGIIERFKRKN